MLGWTSVRRWQGRDDSSLISDGSICCQQRLNFGLARRRLNLVAAACLGCHVTPLMTIFSTLCLLHSICFENGTLYGLGFWKLFSSHTYPDIPFASTFPGILPFERYLSALFGKMLNVRQYPSNFFNYMTNLKRF